MAWVWPLAEPSSALRWCPTWLAVAFRVAPCSWPKAIQTSAGTPAAESATWTSCASLSSSTVRQVVAGRRLGSLAKASRGGDLHLELQAGPGQETGSGRVAAGGPWLTRPRLPAPPGESVEENANVVVRLLIRKPECFGPALRGEGGSGLLAAIEEAIRISEDPARDGPGVRRDRRREQ